MSWSQWASGSALQYPWHPRCSRGCRPLGSDRCLSPSCRSRPPTPRSTERCSFLPPSRSPSPRSPIPRCRGAARAIGGQKQTFHLRLRRHHNELQLLTCGRTMVLELSAHTTSTLLLTSTLYTWPTDVWKEANIGTIISNNTIWRLRGTKVQQLVCEVLPKKPF